LGGGHVIFKNERVTTATHGKKGFGSLVRGLLEEFRQSLA